MSAASCAGLTVLAHRPHTGFHPTPRNIGERVMWIGIIALLIAVSGWLLLSRPQQPSLRAQINAPDKFRFNFVGDNAGPPIISPNGRYIVFSASAEGRNQLYLRSIGELTLHALQGTENATFPFWSPDSRSVAFFVEGKIKRVDIAGGPPVIVSDAPQGRGGTWGASGVILFAPSFNSPLFQVPASGGTPAAVTKMDAKYTTHRWPSFLPDGRHFVYLAANHVDPSSQDTALFFASLEVRKIGFWFRRGPAPSMLRGTCSTCATTRSWHGHSTLRRGSFRAIRPYSTMMCRWTPACGAAHSRLLRMEHWFTNPELPEPA